MAYENYERTRTVFTDASPLGKAIKALHLSEFFAPYATEKALRTAITTSPTWPTLTPNVTVIAGSHWTYLKTQLQAIANADKNITCTGHATQNVNHTYDNTFGVVGKAVLAAHLTQLRNALHQLQSVCMCNCNYCTCNCNYCTCNCNCNCNQNHCNCCWNG